MANNPTIAMTTTLVSGATAMVDMLTSTIRSCSLRLNIEYAATPTGDTTVALVDGFGGIVDPAVTWPYNQPLPLAYAVDGTHPCSSVAWGLDYTAYPLSTLVDNKQTLTIQYNKTLGQPPWSGMRIFNNTDQTLRFWILVEQY